MGFFQIKMTWLILLLIFCVNTAQFAKAQNEENELSTTKKLLILMSEHPKVMTVTGCFALPIVLLLSRGNLSLGYRAKFFGAGLVYPIAPLCYGFFLAADNRGGNMHFADLGPYAAGNLTGIYLTIGIIYLVYKGIDGIFNKDKSLEEVTEEG